MLTHGEVVLYRVGIAIFGCIEKELLEKEFDETLYLIRSCTSKLNSEVLLKAILASKISHDALMKKYAKTMEETAREGGGSPLKKKQQQQKKTSSLTLATASAVVRSRKQSFEDSNEVSPQTTTMQSPSPQLQSPLQQPALKK